MSLGGVAHVTRPAPLRTVSRSRELSARARQLIPAGCHTYAKADDQYPEELPVMIQRGAGCRVWDVDGNEFIELGMGLRTVTLGHAFEPVVAAVQAALALGTNYSRPAAIEVECAEMLRQLVPCAEMVKFCKNGSDALDGAVKLARAHTGRDSIAICGDQPFFSVGDWFIGTTGMPGGVPQWVREHTLKFTYNDLPSLAELFARHPGEIACVIMEASNGEEPTPGFLQGVAALCREQGALFVLDEMITVFRWHKRGAQHVYGVTPDLAAFGKALANGFSVSALTGRRELMERGGFSSRERVFLLSTTHGAEVHALAAALATMRFYDSREVTEVLHERGGRLAARIADAAQAAGVERHFELRGRSCALVYVTRDAQGKPSQEFRTLFLQETLARGLIAPSLVVSYSHSEADIDAAADIIGEALRSYRTALD
ncbi:MAG TPA: glutamate-1-semialdehyde 2,1-aminomutase, partial [Steroidobacteraceae bacterium]|nr:glutamate-1-semialdehyde 2,1-aminomutase [Steroidobacteraceae bacterium]